MKLLINICSHDGIISHYNGVGTMTLKYIAIFSEILSKKILITKWIYLLQSMILPLLDIIIIFI